MSPADRDAYAEELLHRIVRPLALLIRAQGPDAAVARWRELPAVEQEAAMALFAGAYPVEPAEADVYGWLARVKVRPLHADEYAEAPRPLVVGTVACAV